MKTVPVLFLLVACGSSVEVQTPATKADIVKTTRRTLKESPQSLDEARVQVLADAYQALDADEYSATNALQHSYFKADEVFVKISLSDVLPVRMSRPVTLLVPAGTETEPVDPNRADEFYVELGATSTLSTELYGPFPLLGQVGSHCGGFVVNQLRCAEGLVCVTDASHPDASGTCEVAG